jgi:bifunctional DNase/RNase
MVAASDGSLWVMDRGRGRVVHVTGRGTATVVYRSGQVIGALTAGEPWMIATAATDVVLVDRQRQAWRFDLREQQPRPLRLPGLEDIGARSSLLAALQHRPPLEIFNLYVVDAARNEVRKWSPGDVVPVAYPQRPERFLTGKPDLRPADARDIFVDVNLWLLQASTVTRVNFGVPLPQEDYSLDPPPDGEVRHPLDYRLLDGATVGDRELFYVYDAANARILGFQRADGAFVRQWMAPRTGQWPSRIEPMRDQPFGRVRLIEMVVESVRVHMLSSQHVVILKESERDRYLPIWIGPSEANAIAMRLQGLTAERPLTHDLLVSVLGALNSSLSRVVVTHVTEGTFHARLYLELADGSEAEIDSRTSDAIAVAVRTGSTIYVDERVLDEAGVEPEQEDGEADEKLAVFREFVNSLDVDLESGESPPPEEQS